MTRHNCSLHEAYAIQKPMCACGARCCEVEAEEEEAEEEEAEDEEAEGATRPLVLPRASSERGDESVALALRGCCSTCMYICMYLCMHVDTHTHSVHIHAHTHT
jgi:hypothetical protein